MASGRLGIWLIGARGGVATTATVGLCALARGLVGESALVSRLPAFAGLDLSDWNAMVVAGHEIRGGRLRDEAERLAEDHRAFDPELVRQCADLLDEADGRIRPGTLIGCGPTISALADLPPARDRSPREAVERIKDDIRRFAETEQLAHVIVVNVASTEPPVAAERVPDSWALLNPMLDELSGCPLRASSLYAVAAMELGCSYINFTPSLGSDTAALDELARTHDTRHMGRDGKTGETLMKSVLAPMFHHRNLRVMSWVGHNIFGNLDGKVLDDPVNKASKVASKDHLLREILGYAPQTLVSIEYIESLGDWKTAWDHIHFQGFLGTPMTLQFTWQGCDSLLAAPLVLDLIRFTDLARRRGQVGQMTFLASFFKSPQGVTEQGFVRQFQMLEQWAAQA
ncbi:MAG: inositol-3-phosphate synthase [Thermoguttaceae bacterium]|jgi:myo-inositol-1-phosphate synthase